MQIDKQQILDLIKNQTTGGSSDQVDKAEQHLPDQVDTDQHADLLGKLGVNPQDLLGKLGDGDPAGEPGEEAGGLSGLTDKLGM